ncbi:DNA repair protein RadA [Actinomadura litoris]|nr:DNA repair protein RadA [Actinomadura litoris]
MTARLLAALRGWTCTVCRAEYTGGRCPNCGWW